MGPSGSGKSTLLHCLAGIFAPDSGEVTFDGRDLTALSDRERTRLRRTDFGFVFQFGQLVPELTAVDNIALPLLLAGVRRRAAYEQARCLVPAPGPGRPGRPTHRRTVRRPGPTGRRRPGPGHRPEGALRRRTDRRAGLPDRREGDGPDGRHGPRRGHRRRAGHPRRAGRLARRPADHGPRRSGHRGGGRPSDDPLRTAHDACAADAKR